MINHEGTRHSTNTSAGFEVGYFWTYLFSIEFRNPVDCWGCIPIEILMLHKSIMEVAVWKTVVYTCVYHCAGICNLNSETIHHRLNILSNLTKISWFTTCVVSLNNYWLVAIGPPLSVINFVSGTNYVIFSCFFLTEKITRLETNLIRCVRRLSNCKFSLLIDSDFLPQFLHKWTI